MAKKIDIKNKMILKILCGILVICVIVFITVFATSDESNPQTESAADTSHVMCTVTETRGDCVIAAPATNSDELEIANRYQIEITNEIEDVQIGSVIDVEYTGEIKETYPAEFSEIVSMKIVYKSSNSTVEMLNGRLTDTEKEMLETATE